MCTIYKLVLGSEADKFHKQENILVVWDVAMVSLWKRCGSILVP